VLRRTNFARVNLIHELTLGICKASFRKVSNGQYRNMFCTLNSGMIPEKYKNTLLEIYKTQENPDILPVFDIKEQAWKSFYIPKLVLFITSDELKKDKRFT